MARDARTTLRWPYATTNALGTVGPMKYTYDFDTYDTGGPLATSVTSGPVSFDIFMAATPGGPGGTGAFAGEKFTQSFMDSSGSIGTSGAMPATMRSFYSHRAAQAPGISRASSPTARGTAWLPRST